MTPPPTAEDVAAYRDLVAEFDRSIIIRGKSKLTAKSYRAAATLFGDHVRKVGGTLVPSDITRRQIEEFMEYQVVTHRKATAATRHRGLQQFFKWLLTEGEIEVSPMVGVHAPSLDESTVPMLEVDEFRALLDVCEGPSFIARRDTAIIRMFYSSGARLTELAGMRVTDLQTDAGQIEVFGKGSRSRHIPFDPECAVALDRYLRMRKRHPKRDLDALWLSGHGPFTSSGVYQAIKRRADEAGVKGMHPHRFRHTFSHEWLAAGGSEGGLCEINGWRSTRMLQVYARSARSQRALAEYRTIDRSKPR